MVRSSWRLCVIIMFLMRRRGLIMPDAAIRGLGFPEGIAMPFQRLIKLYLQHMLKTSCAKPLLKLRKFFLLKERILFLRESVGPFKTFQKYLNFRISRRQASGSTPQNRRTIEGEVERGQLISVFRVCVWRCSSSFSKSFPTSSLAGLL